MLLLLLFQAINPATAPPPSHRKAIFSNDDYPLEAIRNHWEGTVIVDLTIDPQGSVSACQIAQSTGHKLLDDTTCDLITKRAKFKPATDSEGSPIEGRVRTPLRWRLP